MTSPVVLRHLQVDGCGRIDEQFDVSVRDGCESRFFSEQGIVAGSYFKKTVLSVDIGDGLAGGAGFRDS